VSGKGFRSQASVRIYLTGIKIDDLRANSQGRFSELVEIPSRVDPGTYSIKAGCSGHWLGSAKISVLRSRFSVRPRTIDPGDSITVSGSACPARVSFSVRLDGEVVATGRTSRGGRSAVRIDIPNDASEDAHRVSARCHGKFIGSQLIEVVDTYPTQQSLLTTDRTAVPAGQAVTVSGTKCPTGHPMASLDGRPVALHLGRSVKGAGFTATATVPATPGTHSLWAGCDAGSAGTAELHVLNPAEPAAARQAFGSSPPPTDLTMWAGRSACYSAPGISCVDLSIERILLNHDERSEILPAGLPARQSEAGLHPRPRPRVRGRAGPRSAAGLAPGGRPRRRRGCG
jgi:hypothetical protein